ncbi:hypothetical protein [Rhizobium rhizogenes]|uniref:hypothetical protein n=1 Tax=Rhizobium rhizogenes TaxID=359 RepID=UPI0015728382|nr:hypothetical protein [Rhizobium rhizogenes]NTF80534.1 hypothetical protein [Rhizobium rhizogenes]
MPTKTLVRSLADADPGYAAAKSLVDKLTGQRSKLDAEENILLERLRNRPPAVEETRRVAALLGDEPPSDNAEPDGLRARLKTLAAERVDLRAAIDIANQRLATARHGASAIICKEVKPAYEIRVKALAGALIAAHVAHEELLALISDLNDADITWTGALPPMQASNVFGHDGGRVGGWLHEAAQAGFVDKKIIPLELAR